MMPLIQTSGVERDRYLLSIAFPVPTYSHRVALWSILLTNEEVADRRELQKMGRLIGEEDLRI